MNTTIVKRMKKESQIEITQKVGRFNGIESEIHYRMISPKMKTGQNLELVEDFRKESVMVFEIEAQADELTTDEKDLLKRVEEDFNLRSPLSLDKKTESKPNELPVSKNERAKPVSRKNISSKNRSMSDSTKKEVKTASRERTHRRLVFDTKEVKLLEGDKVITSVDNKNRVKQGELVQGSDVDLTLKNKSIQGNLKSMYWNPSAKQYTIVLDVEGKRTRVGFNNIFNYAHH
jgi:hypothetical protein